MKGFDLKMSWNDFVSGLNKRKANNPNNYETWKNNLNQILQVVFDEIIIAFNGQ
jgi:hypothetical protein